ncbi:unnamed protein product [Linum trigynum]|uniref:Dirigent protein n=1 Tax=Linum trigynum TaxID=586398 RepID=A0AAV2FR09_9ROSI
MPISDAVTVNLTPIYVAGIAGVKLTFAAVSSSNVSSLLVEADWLLTFGSVMSKHYDVVEASVLYDDFDGGSQLKEVAAGRLSSFDVVWPELTFSIGLKAAAAGDGGSVLGDVVDGTTGRCDNSSIFVYYFYS